MSTNTYRLLGLAALLACGPALAAETDIALKPDAARELVVANCSGCHSLDYIQMNSGFLKPDNWKATVTKMVKVMGAPIPEQDVPTIVEYLGKHYGAQ